MKRFLALCAVLVVGIFVLNGFITQASNQDSFWNDAAQSGMAEVMLANLALQKSSSDEIKEMAQKIVDDHTMANNELKDLAATKSVTLPTDVNVKQKETYDKLNGMSGEMFNQEFVKVMVKDHEKAVKLFQKESTSGKDTDLRAFAAKNLPTLQSHLEMAQSMNTKMKGMKMNSDGDKNMNSNMNMNSNSNSNSNSNMTMDSNSNSNVTMDSNSNSNSNMTMDSNMNMNSNSNMNMNSDKNKKRNTNSNSNVNSNSNSNMN